MTKKKYWITTEILVDNSDYTFIPAVGIGINKTVTSFFIAIVWVGFGARIDFKFKKP